MGGKRTMMVLSAAAVLTMLAGPGVASAEPPPAGGRPPGRPVPVLCGDWHPPTSVGVNEPDPGGGQMIHGCGTW
jgi:hypothetical protein